MAQESGDSAEGTAQVGMNFNLMMENIKYRKTENLEAFGTENPANFVSACTEKGDLIVMEAHKKAREAIKAIAPNIKVGLTLSLHDIQTINGGEKLAEKEWNEEFSHYIPYIKEDDFFGLQNYTRSIIGPDGILPVPEGTKITQMEYENYPEGLENVIRRVDKEFKKNGIDMPIMVTENGIATADDNERVEYIKTAVNGVKNCINDGITVLGYMYWSLLDNFEWQKGYSMTFGLIEVDKDNMNRKPKESLRVLGEIS
jgi:beta-glucosidase bgl1A